MTDSIKELREIDIKWKNRPCEIRDEVTEHIYFSGTYDTCRDWLRKREDWAEYLIVSVESGRALSFVLD